MSPAHHRAGTGWQTAQRTVTSAGAALTSDGIVEMQILAAEIRKGVFEAIGSYGVGHVGGSMSIADALAVLYSGVAQVDPTNPQWPDRDRIVLSKGHAGPALYAALALRGFFPREWLVTMNQGNSRLPSHADRNLTPGVDFSTGPLAQGFSMAAGTALAAHRMGRDFTTYAIIGDGECDEGQVWEAALFAAHHKLANLVAFLDFNKQQNDGFTTDVCDKGDLGAKFREFGWFVQMIDGHDVAAIYAAITAAKGQVSQPSMIVLDTIKGHGCQTALDAGICHSIPLSAADAAVESRTQDQLIASLRGASS